MAAVKAARHGVLAPHLKPDHVGIASINSPMQCMMKEVCAQCLQKHVDPVTGKETIIFSCFNQDQEMDRVDFPNLAARLRQNTVQEKLVEPVARSPRPRPAVRAGLGSRPEIAEKRTLRILCDLRVLRGKRRVFSQAL